MSMSNDNKVNDINSNSSNVNNGDNGDIINKNNINSLIKQYVFWPELENDFQKNIHFGRVKMKSFIRETNYLMHYQKPVETQIALFYLANEKLSSKRRQSNDLLDENALSDYKKYKETLNELSKELLTYIIVCSIVEARHITFSALHNTWPLFVETTPDYNEQEFEDSFFKQLNYPQQVQAVAKNPHSKDFIKDLFKDYRYHFVSDKDYAHFVDFTFKIAVQVPKLLNQGHYEEDSLDRDINMRNLGYRHIAKNFVNQELSDYTLEQVLSYLVTIFNDDNKFGEGYGGSAWANIAKHGLQFVQGKINTELFIDQAFSLEHNNGNMFNKDFIFNKSSSFSIFYHFYNEQYQQNIDQGALVDLTQILLNCQHMGVITDLLNFPFESLSKYDLDKFYLTLKTDGVFDDFGPTYDIHVFKEHCQQIQTNYHQINTHLKPVLQYISTYEPHLLESDSKGFLDFRELFFNIGKQSDALYRLTNATHPDNNNRFFVLWNKIHNHYLQNNQHKQDKSVFAFQVFDLNNLPQSAFDKNIIGSKAYGIANMNQLGLPTPKGKVFTTACCHSFYEHKQLFSEFLHKLLPAMSLYLRDFNHNPILCSIRSGAPVSMPGMMDTILNVGIDDSNYDYFCEKMGKKVTHTCINKFMTLFCSAKFNINVEFNDHLQENLITFKKILIENNISVNENNLFPLSGPEQIEQSLYAVFQSWNSTRAISYRNKKGISHTLGTAAIIQEMVMGHLNENSCTGVVFSRDCLTGENKLVGEFLPKTQGEDIVSGSVTPFNIEQLKVFNQDIYTQLFTISKQLENQTGQIQDIEFTVENNKLYILQHRSAVCSPRAIIKLLSEQYLNTDILLSQLDLSSLHSNYCVETDIKPTFQGISANPGVIQGIVVRSENEMDEFSQLYSEQIKINPQLGWIFFSQFTSPEHMPIMNKTDAFITEQGGFTSHAAIIARSLNKPCIVGIHNQDINLPSGSLITLDAQKGFIWPQLLPIVKNNHLITQFSTMMLEKNNIDLTDINKSELKEYIYDLNNKNKSWLFKFNEAYYVNHHLLKKQEFLNLSNKVALVLTANHKSISKLKL